VLARPADRERVAARGLEEVQLARVEPQPRRLARLDAGTAELSTDGEQHQAVTRLDPASRIEAGKPARLWLDTSKLHFFEPASGDSLTVGRSREHAGAG
jgi:multiple sugar transport system ATP-binding protein